MVFTRFVQVGRLVLINYGEDKNKLAVIVDIVDHNRVLVDGPVKRQVISLKRVDLTDQLIETLPRGARTSIVKKHLEKSGAIAQFEASETGQKLAKSLVRRDLNDFQRHQVKVLKQKRAHLMKA